MKLALPVIRNAPSIASTPEIDQLLCAGAPVAIGVSGGKDSTAAAFATVRHLDAVGHSGPRVLIHSDLGVTEWSASIEWCHKLADRLGLELIVVRRAKGDMMERWEQRWADNVARYLSLSCVQVILPWSTPGMRFCTSEMKVAPICRELIRRFPNSTILSVTGIRRQESSGRQHAPVSKSQPKLKSVAGNTTGIDWHPLVEYSLDDVLDLHGANDFPLHPAYTEWGLGRVSCMNCIMQSDADAAAVAKYPGSHQLHRRIVALEIVSTFAFQGNRWRGDVAPRLLTAEMRGALAHAKHLAERRQQTESEIPKYLLYTKGWPTCVPTVGEANLLAGVRTDIAEIMGWRGQIGYFTAPAIIERYQELIAKKRLRDGRPSNLSPAPIGGGR